MKKIIIVALIFFATAAKAEMGQFGILAGYGREVCGINYTECELRYRFDFQYFQIIPFGGWQTWFYMDSQDRGHPVIDIYTYGSQLKIGNVTIEYKHFCSHQVEADHAKYVVQPFIPRGNYTAVSIKYEKWF